MTLIKGTFPVRFRRDGKDGVNTWIKYAVELDLQDSSTGKYYPRVMYDAPTDSCKYIGIGSGVGNEPNDGRYYEWKKFIGDDGTSFTAKGQAVAHHASLSAYNSATKSAGLHLVDNSSGALLKYWNGSATTDKTSVDGDAYTTSDKHLWVKDGATWNDLGEIQGPKGDKTYLHYITVDSYSYGSSGSGVALIKKQIETGVANTLGGSASRGLTVWAISKTGTAITKYGTYDTYGDTAAADSMAQSINGGIVGDNFLAVTSYDGCGFSANLIAALKNYGGGDIADYTPKKQAFSFLGYKGMPEGTAQQVLNIGEGKQASIYSLVNNGICQGKGQDGTSVVSVNTYYAVGTTKITDVPSDSSFDNDTLSEVVIKDYATKYIWSADKVLYSNGNTSVTGKHCIGLASELTSVTEQYAVTTTDSAPTSGWNDTYPSSVAKGSYIWTRDKIEWKNGDITYSTAKKAAYISKDGAAGNSITGVTNKYLAGTSSTTAPTGTWQDDIAKAGFSETNKFLWNKETVTYSISASTESSPRVIAVWGEKGTSIKGVEEQYARSQSSSTQPASWADTVPTLTPTYKYLWNRERVIYDDGKTGDWFYRVIGVYGDQGEKGEDALSYKLTSSIVSLPLNNDGSPQISSFTLKAYMFKGTASVQFNKDDNYQIVVYISYSASDTPITKNVTLSSTVSGLTVELKDDNGDLLKDIKSITCNLFRGSAQYESFAILPVKAGAAGVSYFPNNRGYWQPDNEYKWTGMSRDMVTYNIGGKPYLFAVKTAGTTVSVCPAKDDGSAAEGWEKADSPFSMLFANFVYTDNASVGGFVFSAEQMRSVSTNDGKSPAKDGSNCNILIDGNSGLFKANRVELTGTINATGGSIGEFTILDKGLGLTCTADEADISMTCKSNTKRRARIYVTPTYDNAVIYASTDTKTAAQFYAWESSGTALKVYGKTTINGAVNITGDITLSGLFSGLRLSTTTMSSTGTIPSGSDVICFTNSSNITVTMPSASTYKGRILFLKKTGSGGVTLNGSFVEAGGTGSTATSREHVGSAKSMIYVSNGTYWIEFYCG